MSVDERWYRQVNSFAGATPWLHGVLSAYALWGGLVVLALMLGAAYLVSRHRVDAERMVAVTVCAGLGVVAALLINQHLISPGVGRVRPCHALDHVEVLLPCANDYSFPSDHCVLAGAFAVGLAFAGLRWAVPAGLLAVLLAFTRVYTGVHYPSDAAAGLIVGAAIDVVTVVVLRHAAHRLTRWLASTLARLLVRPGYVVSPRRPSPGESR